ncbi:MAG: hypothetical protein FJX77_04845, partial [Armatimonadetes bacterium]|nr:hypothetical protein [Armatimonadota bacterium]
MVRRIRSWFRTWVKLTLLILVYFWVGAAYKLVYAQTHDVSRFRLKLQLPYYQQQFLLDSLLRQTWMFGPHFSEFLGDLPPLAALFGSNPIRALSAYCRAREEQLASLPNRHPFSALGDEALDAAYTFSQVSSVLGVVGAQEEAARALTRREGEGWRGAGLPDFTRLAALSRRLADEYPDSPQAPAALLRLAGSEMDSGNIEEARRLYERIAREYPRSEQAEQAANALYALAHAADRLEAMREYRNRALYAAERRARDRAPGRALPASTTVALLGYRVDLSGIELQLERLTEAAGLISVAERESTRVRAIPNLEDRLKGEAEGARRRMRRVQDLLWVRRLYDDLKLPSPGLPPRPREFPVRGRVLLNGKPVAGVEVGLTDQNPRIRGLDQLLGVLKAIPLRAPSAADGTYTIPGVPSGEYSVVVVHPTRVGSGRAVTPDPELAFPARIRVEAAPYAMPELRFRYALSTRTFGEQPPAGSDITLAWDPWPGADRYRVEVLAPAEARGIFQRRIEPERRREWRRRPILWQAGQLRAPQARCPLAALYPDNPQLARLLAYEYVVTALDGKGRPLVESSQVLSRFTLSDEARAT